MDLTNRPLSLLGHQRSRSISRNLLEQSAEMMGVFEAQQVGHFTDDETFHQKGFRLIDDEGMDVSDGCSAGGVVDHITEVACRIGQFGCTVCNGGKSSLMLQTFGEIVDQQTVKAFQDVAFAAFLLRQLPLIDSLAIIQNQLQVTD